MGRVQLHHLPAHRPRRQRQQRPVIVTGGLHPDLHPGTSGQHRLHTLQSPGQTLRRHREVERTQQPMATGIGHRQRDRVLTDVNGHHNRTRLTQGIMNRHNPPPEKQSGGPALQRLILEGI
jgi:hypothetical protein